MKPRHRFTWLMAGLCAVILTVTTTLAAHALNLAKTGSHTEQGISYSIEGSTLSVTSSSVKSVFDDGNPRQQVTVNVSTEHPAGADDVVFGGIHYVGNLPAEITIELPSDYTEMFLTLAPSQGEVVRIPLFTVEGPSAGPSDEQSQEEGETPSEDGTTPSSEASDDSQQTTEDAASTQPAPSEKAGSDNDDQRIKRGLPASGWGEWALPAQVVVALGVLALIGLAIRFKGDNHA